ncbi:MAG: hypothetical protein A3G96_01105 [Gammaproteobacteria bacterium RIFCSPLOWO2_12_FULL_52_10]|nr:MAG: hypothetical protein A3G96_01105 [Gammaproteobacteria bacterium RIFCSPLOWO2_12_FULL_52_10]
MQIIDIESRSPDAGGLALELEPGARITVLLEYLTVENPHNTMELLRTGLQHKQAMLISISESDLADCIPGANVLLAQAAAPAE